MKEFQVLHRKEAKKIFGAFYQGRALKCGRKVLLHPLSFLLRRTILVYLVIAGPEELVYSMMIFMSSTLLSELILYQTEALQSISKRHLSTLNELVTLLVSYSFLTFDILEVEANF